MKRKMGILLMSYCIFGIQIQGLCADNLEQLIAAHLKSIGEADVLSQIKSIGFTGTSHARFTVGWRGQISGTAMLVSEGTKMGIVMRYEQHNYPEEHIAYDGRNVNAANTKPGEKSPLAAFLYQYDTIMKNGLLGGVFSKAWPLLDSNNNKPNIRNMKVRKTRVEKTELYELEYTPRDSRDAMKIRLFFDPETYRHVRTEYSISSHIYIAESFGNFKDAGSLTLPHRYTLKFESVAGFTGIWEIDVHDVKFNISNIDPKFFSAGN